MADTNVISRGKKGQLQCPNCQSFKTQSISTQNRIKVGGAILVVGGIFFCISIIGIFIGVPMLLLGICIIIAAAFVKDNGNMKCRNCNFRFNKKAL